MIYLCRYTRVAGALTVAIAAVEDPARAPRYEARGYQRCTLDSFREAWRLRDLTRLLELRRQALAQAERARAVSA